jgi:hypothetical protein
MVNMIITETGLAEINKLFEEIEEKSPRSFKEFEEIVFEMLDRIYHA